ncbi:MAG: hypothetical protein AAF333_13320 [Planctomycetota bacterium]
MPNKAALIATAERLGLDIDPRWTEAQLKKAIEEAENPSEDTATPSIGSFTGKRLCEFLRDVTGPPRRTRGQRVWLTYPQIERQGYGAGDLRLIE